MIPTDLSLLYFFKKSKSFFGLFLFMVFAQVWKTSLLFSRTAAIEFILFCVVITEHMGWELLLTFQSLCGIIVL